MKVLLTTNSNAIYENYITLMVKNPFDLESQGIDNGELDSLFIDEIINFVPHARIEPLLDYLVKKVRIGGHVILSGPDFIKISRDFNNFVLNLETVNKLISGKSITDHKFAQYILQKSNVKINRLDYINNYYYTIYGERTS